MWKKQKTDKDAFYRLMYNDEYFRRVVTERNRPANYEEIEKKQFDDMFEHEKAFQLKTFGYFS